MVGVYDDQDELWRGVRGFAQFALDKGWRRMRGWKASDERTWEHCQDSCPACLRIMQEYEQAAKMAQVTVNLLREIHANEKVPDHLRADCDQLLLEGFGIDVGTDVESRG